MDDGEKDGNGMDEDASPAAADDEAIGERSPANGSPADGLPEGWTQRYVPRKNGHRFDPYWFSPIMSYRFNSLPQARRFLDCLERAGGDEVVAYDSYSKGKPKQKRRIDGRERKVDVVGDSMETARAEKLATSQVCSNDAAHANTSSHNATDSIVSSSTTSSLCSSAKLSLAAPEGREEPSKEQVRHEPLFKMRLRLNIDDPRQHKGSSSRAESTFDDLNDRDESQKSGELPGVQLTIQQLLSLVKQRKIEQQATMTLSQLKQEARNKARANQKTYRQPKRNKRNGRHSKPKSPPPDPLAAQELPEKIEMNTGVLYLYRGEHRSAKFVRWY